MSAVHTVAEGTPWPGQWVTDHLGVELTTTAAPAGLDLRDLVGLAVRRNPRRAHLLVSRVLGKHIPTDPREVYRVGLALGALVRSSLEGPDPAVTGEPVEAIVLGYAETATGLGHCVADALGSPPYLHSTRRRVPGIEAASGFEEEHSHATVHLLLPADPAFFRSPAPLVLVDDELSTGRTVLNTIAALHRLAPRARYVIAALVDVRDDADRARLDERAAELGTRIDVVALASGRVVLSPDVMARAGRTLAEHTPDPVADPRGRAEPTLAEATPGPVADEPASRPRQAASVRHVDLGWPAGLPESGRHGFRRVDHERLEAALPLLGSRLADAVTANSVARQGSVRVLVLGTEELMYVPLRLATALADELDSRSAPPAVVQFSTTTRSPVLPIPDPSYAIHTALTFPSPSTEPAHMAGMSSSDPAISEVSSPRYAYNLQGAADVVVVVVDQGGGVGGLRAAGGLLDALCGVADDVVLVVLPDMAARAARAVRDDARTEAIVTARGGAADERPTPLHGPEFGSYAPDEVAWLLTDLSAVRLEAPVEEREEAIQNGRAHYSESLPIEYQPSAEYQQLFHEALAEGADRIAHAVGVVTERVLAARSGEVTLVSLARAGTPIGILMRRWAQHVHGIDLPHYAVSIVRGRGIDTAALCYLAAHHDPRSVMFVDGWTGKGAIARELTSALEAHATTTGVQFPTDLAVLADPGHCVRLFGTREDFLIPSACLNSTVSGLVSRTVLNAELLRPSDWHGAKFYAELADADVSNLFLEAVSDRFRAVADAVRRDWPDLAAHAAEPDWSGWAAVASIAARYGIDDLNLVKPGVGEATRVLLRRVPWRILVRADAAADLTHVRLLAADRGVPVESVPDLPYSCVGLIQPGFARVPPAAAS